MITKKYKATIALLCSMAGCAATYPYSAGFGGGILHNGFLAAMVGGLADWFAVTALFRKPLGIRYRTEIIPRNRERIFNELVDFVSSDLLNPPNIMKVIHKYDTSKMLLAYLEENDGQARTKIFANDMVQMMLQDFDTQKLGNAAENIIKDGAKKVALAPLLLDAVEWSIAHKYDEATLDFILDEVVWIVQQENMKNLLVRLIDNAKENYEGDRTTRQMASMIFAVSSEKLADAAHKEIVRFLEGLHDPNHKVREKIKHWLQNMLQNLRNSEVFSAMVMQYQTKYIDENFNVAEKINQTLQEYIAKFDQDKAEESVVDQFIDKKVAALQTSIEIQRMVDEKIKGLVEKIVTREHGFIVDVVQERLHKFSNDKLVTFIENRVGDDLQMIRINGSVVGGIVGMLIYLITYVVERMCA